MSLSRELLSKYANFRLLCLIGGGGFGVKKLLLITSLFLVSFLYLSACKGPSGPPGPPGPAGPAGVGLTEEQASTLEAAGVLATNIPFPALEAVNRGCPACHLLVDPDTGAYTLAFEAFERAKARGAEHPPAFKPTDDVNVTTCLTCHAVGTGPNEGKGNMAPWSLRDIVHPAHMSSQVFKLHYGGNCFTCHNVNGEGDWEVLSEAVDVNEKGVPNPNKLPIPGALEIK